MFSCPQRLGSPNRSEPIKTGDKSFALTVGMVDHWVGKRLVINSTIGFQHLLNPGVVIREVITKNDEIIIKTSGYGMGVFPNINSGQSANFIWNIRTDSNIISRIKNE